MFLVLFCFLLVLLCFVVYLFCSIPVCLSLSYAIILNACLIKEKKRVLICVSQEKRESGSSCGRGKHHQDILNEKLCFQLKT